LGVVLGGVVGAELVPPAEGVAFAGGSLGESDDPPQAINNTSVVPTSADPRLIGVRVSFEI
jgi:hypothetical protein